MPCESEESLGYKEPHIKRGKEALYERLKDN